MVGAKGVTPPGVAQPRPLPVSLCFQVERAGSIAYRDGFSKAGQRVIIVAGLPLGTPGSTNMVRIAYVGPDGGANK